MFVGTFRGHDLFSEIDALRRQVDASFQGTWAQRGFDGRHGLTHASRALYPYLTVSEDEQGWTLKGDLPGFVAGDVQLSAEGDLLTLRAERVAGQDEGWTPRHQERRGGSFSRQVRFQGGFDAAGVTAELKDGVLTVRVPRPGRAQPVTIEVRG